MEDHSWMYTGHRGREDYTSEWIEKTEQFVDYVFGRAGGEDVPCPCNVCGNTRPQIRMTMHIYANLDLGQTILCGSTMMRNTQLDQRC
jgi:hypothetical protein